MIESDVVKEWQAEQSVTILIAVLESKFASVPPETEANIRGTLEPLKLQTWITQAAKALTLDEFRAASGL